MNKAEEQYLYRMGWARAQINIMEYGRSEKFSSNFSGMISSLCRSEANILKNSTRFNDIGKLDYYNSILRLIENNVITDWPSFVTHMTGETYEAEVTYAEDGTYTMKCTQCGTALNELMIGRCSQPSHEVPIVLCETCCQASPDCVGCKAQDCDGYVTGEKYE